MLDGHSSRPISRAARLPVCCPRRLMMCRLILTRCNLWAAFIGSAAVVVSVGSRQRKAAALNMLRFFEDESCGQCTPCRVGCEKAVKLMQAETWDQPLLEELCTAMVDASICGLGQAAPNPIRLTMKHFPKRFESCLTRSRFTLDGKTLRPMQA